jgi:hypothetical protein
MKYSVIINHPEYWDHMYEGHLSIYKRDRKSVLASDSPHGNKKLKQGLSVLFYLKLLHAL